MKSKKVFITGTTGFIGSYITRYLLKQGYKELYCLKRPDSDIHHLGEIQSKVNWIEGDLSDIVLLDEIISKMDFIIHAAAVVSFNPKDKELLENVNVQATASLVNFALAHSVQKFIYISSISSLGRAESGQTIDETASWKDSQHNSSYAISKYGGELEVWRGIEEGLPACILNPGIVLGAGKWGQSSTKLFDYIFKGGKFVSNGVNSFVDVRDVAIITEKVLNSNVANERFIISCENLSYKTIFQTIAQHLDKPVPETEIPKWAGELIWRVLKLWSVVTGKDPLITKETFRTSRQSYFYINDKSKKTFNHQYVPLEKTIKDTTESMKKAKAEGQEFGLLSF